MEIKLLVTDEIDMGLTRRTVNMCTVYGKGSAHARYAVHRTPMT
jgi:hypothetical protein